MSDFRVEVEGLKELRSALRNLEDKAPKELAKAGKQAAEVPIDTIVARIPYRTGRTRRSVRAFGTQTSAGIRAGGAKSPHLGWLDFGGKRPGDRVARPRVKAGRYIYPGIKQDEDEIVDTYVDVLHGLLRSLGLQ